MTDEAGSTYLSLYLTFCLSVRKTDHEANREQAAFGIKDLDRFERASERVHRLFVTGRSLNSTERSEPRSDVDGELSHSDDGGKVVPPAADRQFDICALKMSSFAWRTTLS